MIDLLCIYRVWRWVNILTVPRDDFDMNPSHIQVQERRYEDTKYISVVVAAVAALTN